MLNSARTSESIQKPMTCKSYRNLTSAVKIFITVLCFALLNQTHKNCLNNNNLKTINTGTYYTQE